MKNNNIIDYSATLNKKHIYTCFKKDSINFFEKSMSNTILAIDTSMKYCSVAIYKKKYIYSLSEKSEKQHTIQILPMIKNILLHSEVILKELNYIAFTKGPGSFTGMRIAAGVAKSLSISLKIPIIGISTLAVMAEKAWRKYNKKKIIIVINAQIKKVYWAKYTRNKKSIWTGENTESLLNKELIQDKIKKFKNTWTIVGNGWEKCKYQKFLYENKTKFFFPNAKDIIPFVLLHIQNKKFIKCAHNNLNYLYNVF